MKSHEEKRRYQRYDHSSPMHLYRMDQQDQHYYAEMKDYCEGGLSLMTNERLVVGHLVYLEMKNYDKDATGPEKYKRYRGSVKWIGHHSSANRDAEGPHTYGIEYSQSDYHHC